MLWGRLQRPTIAVLNVIVVEIIKNSTWIITHSGAGFYVGQISLSPNHFGRKGLL